jgi:hypothetical protein
MDGLLVFTKSLFWLYGCVAAVDDIFFVYLTALVLIDMSAMEHPARELHIIRLHIVKQVDVEGVLNLGCNGLRS